MNTDSIIFEAQTIFVNIFIVLYCNLINILGREPIKKFIDSITKPIISLVEPDIPEKNDETPDISCFLFYGLIMAIYIFSLPKDYFEGGDPQKEKEEMSRCPIRIASLISKTVSLIIK